MHLKTRRENPRYFDPRTRPDPDFCSPTTSLATWTSLNCTILHILAHCVLLLCRSHVSSAHFWPQNMLLGHFAQERICNLAKLISSPTSPPHFYSFLVQTTLWAHFCSREKRSTQLLLPQWAGNASKKSAIEYWWSLLNLFTNQTLWKNPQNCKLLQKEIYNFN